MCAEWPIVEPEGWKSADLRAFEDLHEGMVTYMTCDEGAIRCQAWPRASLHRLENDSTFRRWRYVSQCCGKAKRTPHERHRDLLQALGRWPRVVAILRARGAL